MIINTKNGLSFDTDKDLTAAERHVLQKLIIWKDIASGIDQFREKKEKALLCGWNNSGPLMEREALKMIIDDLEDKVARRLNDS